MKVSFNLRILGGSMLLATSDAHMAMVEPKWNYGSADTSKCDEIIKDSAGAPFNKATGLFDKHSETGKEFKLFHSCQGNSASDAKKQCMGSQEYQDFAKCLWKQNRQVYWFNTGSQIGCPAATGQVCAESGVEGHTAPCCDDPMEPTLTSPDLLSFTSDVNSTSNKRFNPWFAPGYAPVIDPCGVVGGFHWENPNMYFGGPDQFGSEEPCTGGCFINGAPAPEQMQFKAGTFGSELIHKALTHSQHPNGGEDQPVTQWTAGGVAEVAQGSLFANHGGGYLWRLCPAAEFTADGAKNEECFQRSPLAYASNKSAIKFGAHHPMTNKTGGRRVEFDAVRVTDANTGGVMPRGSTWTKFPVPNCGPGNNLNCAYGPGEKPTYLIHDKPVALNFPEPAKGVYGMGMADLTYSHFFVDPQTALEAQQETKSHFDFTVVDEVKVPKKEGRYVLSWRWDAEEGPQVWNNCALVDIVQQDKGTQKHSLRGTTHRAKGRNTGR